MSVNAYYCNFFTVTLKTFFKTFLFFQDSHYPPDSASFCLQPPPGRITQHTKESTGSLVLTHQLRDVCADLNLNGSDKGRERHLLYPSRESTTNCILSRTRAADGKSARSGSKNQKSSDHTESSEYFIFRKVYCVVICHDRNNIWSYCPPPVVGRRIVTGNRKVEE